MSIVGQKIANAPLGSFPVLSDTVGDSRAQLVKLDFGAVGASDMVTLTNGLPVQIVAGGGGGGGGDATAANQVLQTALLTTIDADTGALVLKDFSTETTLSALNAKVTACNTGAVVIASGTITAITNPVAVTGTFFQATQPVSGTFWQATQPVSGTVTATPETVTPASPAASSVGVASAQILASATYKRVDLTNTSTSTISIGIGAAAVLNSGMTLIGTGSTATIEGPFTANVTAIASGAASNLAIQAWT
jgi:hypothetical protein